MFKEYLSKCSYCHKGCTDFLTCDNKLFLSRLPMQLNDLIYDAYLMCNILSYNISSNLSYESIINNDKVISFKIGSILDATIKTFEDIAFLLNNYSFVNALTIIRKLRDDLFLILFIIKTRLEASDREIEHFLSNKHFESYIRTKEEDIVTAFFNNSIINDKGNNKFYKDFKAEAFLDALRKCTELENCFNKFFEANKQKVLRFLNNHVHSNGIFFSTGNFNYQGQKKIDFYMKNVNVVLQYILNLFLSFIILLQPNLIMGSDYIDNLECGIPPEENSQYRVAPAVQVFITKYMKKELRTYLKENNKYGMEIED